MKSHRSSRLWLLPLTFSTLAAANAAPRQAPTVLLDGQPLALGDSRASVIGGRVLVPMRAIFEALDASVEWDPISTNITARTADNRLISLQPGVRSAAINGRLATLDQPPVISNGRVLVPLRFVSEALGASVSWSAPLQTVSVTRPGTLQIASVQVSGPAMLRAGQTVEVTARGTSGLRGSWRLVPGPTDLPLIEDQSQPGVYRGNYTAREGDDLPITQALVRLEKGSQRVEKMADPLFGIDTVAPVLRQQILQALGTDEFEAVIQVDESSDSAQWKVLAGFWPGGTFRVPGEDLTPDDIPLSTSIDENNRIHVRISRPDDTSPARLTVEDAAGNRAQLAIALPARPQPNPADLDVTQRFRDDQEAMEFEVRDRAGVEAWADIIDPVTQALIGTIPLQLGADGRFIGTLPLDRWQLPANSRVRIRSRDRGGVIRSEIYPLDIPYDWPRNPRPIPRPRPDNNDRELFLDEVRAYGDDVLGEGDTLRIEARGSANARATAYLGAGLGDFRLNEVQAGIYTGTYTIRRGDNARDIRPEVRLERWGRQTERRVYKSFTVDTDAPELRSTSIPRDATLNAIPERIEFEYNQPRREDLDRATATLNTERGRYTLTTRIEGNKVEIRLDPAKINADGRMSLDVRVRDEAGNESRDTLDFRVRAGAGTTAIKVEFDATRRVQSGEEVPVTVEVQNWQRGTMAVGLLDNSGQIIGGFTTLPGRNGTFSGRIKAPIVTRQQDFTVQARLIDGTTILGTSISDRKLTVVNARVPLALEILNVSPNNGTVLKPGDNIAVRIRATSGARVTWSLGTLVRDDALTEYPPGTGNFEGRYAIRRNDTLGDLLIRVRAEFQGNTLTREYTLRGGAEADTTAPTIRLISPADGATLTQAPEEITLDITDTGSGVQNVEAELVRNGGTVDLVVQAQGNRVRLPIGRRLQTELVGAITLRVRAKDAAGNLARQAFRFSVQEQEPEKANIRITAPRRNAGPNFPLTVRGEANPNADVEVEIKFASGKPMRERTGNRYTVKADNRGRWETPAFSPSNADQENLVWVTIIAKTRLRGQEAEDQLMLTKR